MVVVIPDDNYRRKQEEQQDDTLVHYGTPRHSGRYPWGSGETPLHRSNTFNAMVDELKKQNLSEAEIARGLGLSSTTEYRDHRTLLRNELVQDQIHFAEKLKEKGLSNGAIAIRMREAGYKVAGESQVRALLKPYQGTKAKVLDNVTNTLRDAVDKKGYLDVGSGVEFQLDITSTKLRSAIQKLKDEGYLTYEVKLEQQGTGHHTNYKVLTKPGTTWADAQKNRYNIQQIHEYSDDGGMTILGMHPPLSISSKRVGIRYADQGGTEADGVIYVRPGVSDISLGRNRYGQVRILVDGTHYLKGMAIYKDDLPKGVDLLFNTNKKDTGNKHDAMKKISDDPDNPFGATVRQIGERDHSGKITKLTSAMNLVNEEGNWDAWSKSLSSQMLSKQKPSFAKEQLDKKFAEKRADLDTILSLTNPSVRKKLLEAYADGVDSSAVHLKAAHLPRQKTQVILPLPDIKPNEVYAPGFNNGERLALVRFPHGGTFEIPELTVNNNNPAGRRLLGHDAKDAIGIHPKTAERLSGADFDGDAVLVIPNNRGKVRSTPALEGLKNFDPKTMYRKYDGMKVMTPYEKGLEMGRISNLITDMTIKGANTDELARAVRHSMVVIDAEKHELDYKRSAIDNGIPALVKKYQAETKGGGASTLISRAGSIKYVPDRKPRSAAKGGPIDPATGKLVYEYTGKSKTWTDANGKVHVRETKLQTTKLADAEDAHTLVSGSGGTVIEKIYADHSNRLKALANEARYALYHNTKPRPYSPSAKKAYQSEVDSLNSKLELSLRNAPLERQAQVFANATVRLKIQANPALKLKESAEQLRRIKSQALSAARHRTGADKHHFTITDEEWKAIEAGAITAHKLEQILTYADLDRVKELATPRLKVGLSATKTALARNLHAQGYTWAVIADRLGVSVATVKDAIDSGGEGD